VEHALWIQDRYGFSYYDCLMVASAIESGCDYLFTEDLKDGQLIEGVTINNIFRGLQVNSHFNLEARLKNGTLIEIT
jgi:predicted nucleic acid-binding protein